MDIHSIRTLNLAGTVIFGIFGILLPTVYLVIFGFIAWVAPGGSFLMLCVVILIVWIAFIAYLAYSLYNNTVIGLDKGDYETAKRWTLYGLILGFLFGGGIITFVIFLISYISFDDALYPKHYYYPPPYYPYPPQYPYGPPHSPQYPMPSYPCTTCGCKLRFINENRRWYCDKCKKYV